MGKLFKLRKSRKAIRWLRHSFKRFRKSPLPVRIALVVLAFAALWMPYDILMASHYTTNYTPLLDTIGQGESHGNYDAYYGNAGNASIHFTAMTIAQVLVWQTAYLHQGEPSDAVGKYQLLSTTLQSLVRQLELNPNKIYFNEETQDQLAVALLERRGAENYLGGQLSLEQFAANLAQEWAALPRITGANPSESFYAGDGLNKSRVSIGDVYQALDIIKSDRTLIR